LKKHALEGLAFIAGCFQRVKQYAIAASQQRVVDCASADMSFFVCRQIRLLLDLALEKESAFYSLNKHTLKGLAFFAGCFQTAA